MGSFGVPARDYPVLHAARYNSEKIVREAVRRIVIILIPNQYSSHIDLEKTTTLRVGRNINVAQIPILSRMA